MEGWGHGAAGAIVAGAEFEAVKVAREGGGEGKHER